jgi:hypothetical protein
MIGRIGNALLGSHVGSFLIPVIILNAAIVVGVEAGLLDSGYLGGSARALAIGYIAVVIMGVVKPSLRD